MLSTSLLPLWNQKLKEDVGYGDHLLILSRSKLSNGGEFSFIGHSIFAQPDVPYYLSEMRHVPKPFKKFFSKIMFNSYMTLGLFCAGEVSPANCIRPSKSVDQYGIRQVDISYSSSPEIKEKMRKMTAFGRKVLRRSFGTLITENESHDGTGIHYAGTCRMGDHAKEMIVDQNLKSFDHKNLYICDGSVIPHLPDKHLTLTIMALADRLATHLINDNSA